MLGALVSIGGLVAIAGRRASLTVTLLAGLALASFAGAVTALILNLAPNPLMPRSRSRSGCSARSRTAASDHLMIAAPFLRGELDRCSPLNARAFRALTLGEDAAASLGVDIDRTRLMVVIGVALGVGAAVAVAGSIGFVGLVAPHLVRRAVGSDPARVLLPAALTGAALLTRRRHRGAARAANAAAVELKLGVVTALIGVPFFLAMIFRERRLLEGAPS